jgi:hypothetical protein
MTKTRLQDFNSNTEKLKEVEMLCVNLRLGNKRKMRVLTSQMIKV